MQLNISIVLYHNKKEQILKVLDSILNTSLKIKIYLVDNSNNEKLRDLEKYNEDIQYLYNNANLGYGTAHNVAIKKSIQDDIPYHLVINPDIYFDENVLDYLFDYMEENKDVGNVMPNVLYPNNEVQYLCKLLPTPFDLILRRFLPFKELKEKRNNRYELRFTGYDKKMNAPVISGCFMFLRVEILKKVGLFDENFFMYLEDFDLNRRIHLVSKTIFNPEVSIYHEYNKESYRSKKLLYFHLKSAIYYFNKWGWLFDSERKEINERFINSN